MLRVGSGMLLLAGRVDAREVYGPVAWRDLTLTQLAMDFRMVRRDELCSRFLDIKLIVQSDHDFPSPYSTTSTDR